MSFYWWQVSAVMATGFKTLVQGGGWSDGQSWPRPRGVRSAGTAFLVPRESPSLCLILLC